MGERVYSIYAFIAHTNTITLTRSHTVCLSNTHSPALTLAYPPSPLRPLSHTHSLYHTHSFSHTYTRSLSLSLSLSHTESLEAPNLSLEEMQRLRNSDNLSMLESALKEPIVDILQFIQVRQIEG